MQNSWPAFIVSLFLSCTDALGVSGSFRLAVVVAHQQPTDFHPSAPHYITPSSSTTGTMAQPVVQTIHRDPALLYVQRR